MTPSHMSGGVLPVCSAITRRQLPLSAQAIVNINNVMRYNTHPVRAPKIIKAGKGCPGA